MSKITIIYHEVHSYQSCEMPPRLFNEIRRINHLLVSHNENNSGGEGGGTPSYNTYRHVLPRWSECNEVRVVIVLTKNVVKIISLVL